MIRRFTLLLVGACFTIFTTAGLHAQNQLPNPGFEIVGDDGDESAANWQNKGWTERTSADAHSGDWSYQIDNESSNDFGQWKELRPSRPTDDDPDTQTTDFPAIPGEEYTQSLWIKVTEEAFPGSGIFLLTRPNGQNDASVRQQTRFAFDEIELNEWTLLEQVFFMPEEDVNGEEVTFANPIFFIDTAGDPEALEGLFFYDDAYWGPTFDGGILGDFDGSGVLDLADIDMLTAATASGANDVAFDLTGDGAVDTNDISNWVADLKKTWIGDSNLDGEFNSTDFVVVFGKGLFETNLPATWSEGDWNGDGVFGSGDFVAAFTDGGYEIGQRVGAAVPEPTAMSGLFLLVLGCLIRYRRQ